MTIDLLNAQRSNIAPWQNELDISDAQVAVFADKYPVTLGHLLFVPRQNTTQNIISAFEIAVYHGNLLVENSKCQGFNVGINYGAVAGQTVMYPHVHLIPRRDGDCEDPIGGVRRCVDGQGNYKISSYINPLDPMSNTGLIDGQILPEFYTHYNDIVPPLADIDPIPGLILNSDVSAINDIVNRLPQNNTIVEIGSFLGRSATEWANSVKKQNKNAVIYCIDYFQMPADLIKQRMIEAGMQIDHSIENCKTQLDMFKLFTQEYNNINIIQSKFDSKFVCDFEKITCVFDDSDHTEKTLGTVFDFWWPKIENGGILCGHDYDIVAVQSTVQKYSKLYDTQIEFFPNSSVWALQKL
jgi:diadenosine tetraphosphate (Ap4A) HIT family hydrolase